MIPEFWIGVAVGVVAMIIIDFVAFVVIAGNILKHPWIF